MTVSTFAYPGSKTTLAPWIIDHFPNHTQYIEPFGGAASVLVQKERSELEVYNDLNGDCVNFFQAVRDNVDELKSWVNNTPYSRELFERYKKSYPDWPEDSIKRAGRFLYVQSNGFGGKLVGQSTPTFGVITANCYRGSQGDAYEHKWNGKVSNIEDLAERLRGVIIEREDYTDLLERYDADGAFFYFDPPYVDVGDNYYQVNDGGFSHPEFCEEVLNLDGDWLISYGEHIPAQLSDFHTVTRTKEASMSSERPEITEQLIMNYDPKKTPGVREQSQSGLEAYE